MDPELRAAVDASHLRGLPPASLSGLLADARRIRIPAGATLHRQGDPVPHVELVVSGLMRVLVAAPDGRRMAVRYCRRGALIGVISLFATDFALPGAVEALVGGEVLRLSSTVATRAAARDPRVATAFLAEESDRALGFLQQLPGSVFTTVRQRVARHLLDLASEPVEVGDGPPDGAPLVARVSQSELAESVGTAREVVVRVLRELRAEGLVRTERGSILLLRPDRLVAEQEWDPGS